MSEEATKPRSHEATKYEVMTPADLLLKRMENDFTCHAPFGEQAVRYGGIRDYAFTFGRFLVADMKCPPSRELSTALTKLEEVVFWANAAIARNEKPPVT